MRSPYYHMVDMLKLRLFLKIMVALVVSRLSPASGVVCSAINRKLSKVATCFWEVVWCRQLKTFAKSKGFDLFNQQEDLDFSQLRLV